MTKNKDSALSSQVWAGLIVAAIVVVVGLVFTDLSVWIRGAVGAVWKHLFNRTDVPHWLMYMISALLFVAIAQWVVRWVLANPDFKVYVKDTMHGVIWRWQYEGDRPVNAWAFCPTCDATLVYSDIGSPFMDKEEVELHCETCNERQLLQDGSKSYLVSKVLREVERRIRTGEWKKRVQEVL